MIMLALTELLLAYLKYENKTANADCEVVSINSADMEEAVLKKKTCSQCSKIFRRKYDLQTHVKSIHSALTKNKCEQACTFPTSDKR